jgi:hypothetical protein
VHARPTGSNPIPITTDIHDIQALTATGAITLPLASPSGRRTTSDGPRSTPER